ncbi:MAG TPA: hypothetical protein VKC63_10550 [Solirubrobacterales bacterium]|nr:hypothetical protein [Solirubrobacterales bacterium]
MFRHALQIFGVVALLPPQVRGQMGILYVGDKEAVVTLAALPADGQLPPESRLPLLSRSGWPNKL